MTGGTGWLHTGSTSISVQVFYAAILSGLWSMSWTSVIERGSIDGSTKPCSGGVFEGCDLRNALYLEARREVDD